MQLEVKYAIQGIKRVFTTMINNDVTVQEFIDEINRKNKRNDLCAAWLDGINLDNEDLIYDLNPENKVIFLNDDISKFDNDALEEVQNLLITTLIQTLGATEPGFATIPSNSNHKDLIVEEENNFNISQSMRKTKANKFSIERKFQVFTTVSTRSMLEGDTINIDSKLDLRAVKDLIRPIVDRESNQGPFDLYLFLPGGVFFRSGTIIDYYDPFGFSLNHLYVVVTRQNLNIDIDQIIEQPCNISSQSMKSIISPLYETTNEGYIQMACILGYLYFGGIRSETILLSFAKYTRFAPMMCSLFRFLERSEINALSIIAITTCVHTLFHSIIPDVRNNEVFEYAFKCTSYLVQLRDLEFLNFCNFDDDQNAPTTQYIESHQLQRPLIVWWEDFEGENKFVGFNIEPPEMNVINDIFDRVKAFIPIPPVSLRQAYSPCFFTGRNNTLLFIQEVSDIADTVEYIDPTQGRILRSTYDDLGAQIHNAQNPTYCIDPDSVSQITMVCFDESSSMNWNFRGTKPRNGEKTRLSIATDYLNTLIERTKAFRVPSIFGLVSFNNVITERAPLTPFMSTFQTGLEQIVPREQTHLWDAVDFAADKINNINQQNGQVVFKNARLRILTISDGRDSGSRVDKVALANKLINSKIFVDTIVVTGTNDCDELRALSKLTGGLAFQPPNNSIIGSQIFEHESILDLRYRKSIKPSTNLPISEQIFNEDQNLEFDDIEQIPNRIDKNLIIRADLSTPGNFTYRNYKKPTRTFREKRIKQEIFECYQHREDVSVQVYILFNDFIGEHWHILIQAPDGSPYSNRWFRIYATFPEKYPLVPPYIRFVDIPFHPNISIEGRVIFDQIYKRFTLMTTMYSLFKDIQNLLINSSDKYKLNIRAYELYQQNDQQYQQLASQSAERNGKESNIDCINGINIRDEDNNGQFAQDMIHELTITNQLTLTHSQVNNPDDGMLYFQQTAIPNVID